MEQSGSQKQCCHSKKMESVLSIGYLQAQIIRPSVIGSIRSQWHLLSKPQSFCLILLCKLNSWALTIFFFFNQYINYSISTIKITPQTYLLITNNSTLNACANIRHKHKLHSLLHRDTNSEIATYSSATEMTNKARRTWSSISCNFNLKCHPKITYQVWR